MQLHLQLSIAGILVASLAHSSDALAHACAVIDEPDGVAKLFKGNTVRNKLVVKADLDETDTIYIARTRNATIATVSPDNLTAHDGVFDFTGVELGTTVIEVDWSYPPTGASDTCLVPIEVILKPLTLDTPEFDNSPGCGCCRIVVARKHDDAPTALLWSVLVLGAALHARRRRRRPHIR